MIFDNGIRLRDVWKPSTYTKRRYVILGGPVLTVYAMGIYIDRGIQVVIDWGSKIR